MSKRLAISALLAAALVSACGPAPSAPGEDMAKLRQDMQKKTERLYWIHLRLDTASTEIAKAEEAARAGNTSAAEFHAAEAYRSIGQANEAVLELGTQLQEIAGLDRQ